MLTILLTVLLAATTGYAQTEAPEFEVASIKPNHSGSGNSGTTFTQGHIAIENRSLKSLIEEAYDVRDFSFSGPGWLDAERFDIMAKPPDGTPSNQYSLMLQTLLTERFKVAVHRETKTMAGYALILTKTGPKLEPADDPKSTSTTTGRGTMRATAVSMSSFADMLGRQMNQPVQDSTGLTGIYKLKLEWTPDDSPSGAKTDLPSGPGIFTALQEQLGLKLRAQKIQIEMVVVDSAEKTPTEN
jgi:uncharacterized protein (TIGR03435 family)